MKTTARFIVKRKKDLEACFDKKVVTDTWRKIVKKQLRGMDILDLHDYYDFNYSIDQKAGQIIEDILSGQFKTSAPLIYRIEKKLGICRHLMIPSPTDALVFQTIVESIAAPIQKKAPSKQAYYSRDKHNLKLPHEHKAESEYPWQIQWKNFQKDILKFSKSHKYLGVTDLSNFYDSIGLKELRHVISSRAEIPEVILDLIFSMIEELSWNPDYLPSSSKGLPTINIEAVRLLAHTLLFEVDEVLKKATKDSFVRWMDDINFGIDSKMEGALVLGIVNDVLKSRGLALNLSKTSILSASEVQNHYLFDENKFLDQYKDRTNVVPREMKEIKKRYKKHLKDNKKFQNYNKVTKRYLTLFGKLKSSYLCSDAQKFFLDSPSLRKNACYYIYNLGFSAKTSKMLIETLKNVQVYDDVTLFLLAKVITDIEVPRNKKGKEFIDEVLSIASGYKKGFKFYCRLWLLAKYGHPKEVLSTISRNMKMWSKSPFLSRQVVSILPRIAPYKPDTFEKYLNYQIMYGFSDTASVAQNLQSFTELEALPTKLRMYLLPQQKQKVFPLSKFLIAISVLESDMKNRDEFKTDLLATLTDPYYIHWINEYY